MLLICTDSTPPRIFAGTRLVGIAPTGCMRSSGCFLESGVAGGCYPPLQGVCKPVGGAQCSRCCTAIVGVANLATRQPPASTAPVGAARSRPPAAKPLGSPNWRPLQTQKLLAYSNQCTTPPQSARSGCQLPQRWSQGGCAAAGGFEPPLRVRWKPGGWRVAKLATPTSLLLLTMRSYI